MAITFIFGTKECLFTVQVVTVSIHNRQMSTINTQFFFQYISIAAFFICNIWKLHFLIGDLDIL